MTPSPGDLVSWREIGLSPTELYTEQCIGIVIRTIELEEYFASRDIIINPHECHPDELAIIRSGLKQVEVLHNGKIVTQFIGCLQVLDTGNTRLQAHK